MSQHDDDSFTAVPGTFHREAPDLGTISFTVSARDENWLARAKLSIREAEQLEKEMADEGDQRSVRQRMRDELLLAQAEATIAVAEALQSKEQADQPTEDSVVAALELIGRNVEDALALLGVRK